MWALCTIFKLIEGSCVHFDVSTVSNQNVDVPRSKFVVKTHT